MSNSAGLLASDRINLERISFLLVDDNQQALDIVGQVITGFGVRTAHKRQTIADAKSLLERETIDFVLIDAHLPGEDGFELIRWLRHEAGEPNRYAPAVVMTGDTNASAVRRARDVGAHFIIAKPITPNVLLQRIFWVAKENRLFVSCETYAGPDRRFRRLGPPPGINGRRSDDLSVNLGEAKAPNLSQDEINALMKPAKVSL
jgi:CheY-like chemotaxis protein